MFRDYSDVEVKTLVEDRFKGAFQFYSRYTNIHNLKFYLIRDNDIRLNDRGRKKEWYVNFHAFFKVNHEFVQQAAILTFGVAEDFRNSYNLADDQNLRLFIYEEGEFVFRNWLNTITEFGDFNKVVIKKYGDPVPVIRNGKIIPGRNRQDDSRLINLAEKQFAHAILDNNGMQPLRRIDFMDICFVPEEYVRHVELRLLQPENMDPQYGILTETGKVVIDSLLRDEITVIEDERTLQTLILRGESNKLEFKSTLRWDIEKSCKNREIEFMVIKATAGFLNANGGILLIGISDDGSILGLEYDYTTFDDGGWDKFQLCLIEILWNAIPKDLVQSKVDVKRFTIDGKAICVLTVHPSFTPVFLDRKFNKRFYVRVGNSTREIETAEEITRYCISRFK